MSVRSLKLKTRQRSALIHPRPLSSPYLIVFVAGVVGAVLMSILMAVGISMTWSPYGLEMVLGSILTRDISAPTWAVGFAWHLINGGLFALAYAAIFNRIKHSGASTGALIALGHWVFAIAALNGLQAVHPISESAFALNAPGPEHLLGATTFVTSLLLHLAYGATVGAIYHEAMRRRPAMLYGGEIEPAPKSKKAA